MFAGNLQAFPCFCYRIIAKKRLCRVSKTFSVYMQLRVATLHLCWEFTLCCMVALCSDIDNWLNLCYNMLVKMWVLHKRIFILQYEGFCAIMGVNRRGVGWKRAMWSVLNPFAWWGFLMTRKKKMILSISLVLCVLLLVLGYVFGLRPYLKK